MWKILYRQVQNPKFLVQGKILKFSHFAKRAQIAAASVTEIKLKCLCMHKLTT